MAWVRMSALGSIPITCCVCALQIMVESPVPLPRSTTRAGCGVSINCVRISSRTGGGVGRARSYMLASPVQISLVSVMLRSFLLLAVLLSLAVSLVSSVSRKHLGPKREHDRKHFEESRHFLSVYHIEQRNLAEIRRQGPGRGASSERRRHEFLL